MKREAPRSPLRATSRVKPRSQQLVADTLQVFGALDILCNIAGTGGFEHTRWLALEPWQATLGVNLTGTFLMRRGALDALLDQGGCIVNMASVAGLRATPYNAAYSASKAGVIMLTKALAAECLQAGAKGELCVSQWRRHPVLGQIPCPSGW